MCTKYTLQRPTLADVGSALGAEVAAADEARYGPSDAIVPGDVAWIVTSDGDRRLLQAARWNYLTRARRTLSTIPSEVIRFGRFRDVFATRRCAVVADGFYQWPEGTDRPLWHRPSPGDLVLMGGVFQLSRVSGAPARFSVLTARARSPASDVDDRSPVVVGMCDLDRWLNSDFASALAMLTNNDGRHIIRTKV